MSDEWREIENFPAYECSSQGRVRSFWKRGAKQAMIIAPVPQRVLARKKMGVGYWGVCLWADGLGYYRYLHRLVAAAFLGDIPADCVVHHKDSDKANNCFDNLEIMNRMQHESARSVGMWADPEFRKKHRASHSAAMARPETRAKLAKAITEKWQDPEARQKMIDGIRVASNMPKSKAQSRARAQQIPRNAQGQFVKAGQVEKSMV